jgi:hypothetical protein
MENKSHVPKHQPDEIIIFPFIFPSSKAHSLVGLTSGLRKMLGMEFLQDYPLVN